MMSIVVTPLFLLSLPRSGSTLLQRILGRHGEIATGPEPTFLLPLFNLVEESDVVATYDHHYTARAIDDFFSSQNDGAFRATVERWTSDAYEQAVTARVGDGERPQYFLDKTPKYHQIASEIVETFAAAPIVLLWRNPLAVISSMMTTWGGGRWMLQHFRLDLYDGLPRLVDVAERFPDRVLAVRYEDLVSDPEHEVRRLFAYLDLEFNNEVLVDFKSVELRGRVQDPNVGTAGFTSVRDDRVDTWTAILANPLRKRWCRRYLRWLGADRLATMGYDLSELLAELDNVPTSMRYIWSDLYRMPYDHVYRLLEVGVFEKKFRDRRAGRRRLLAYK